MEKQGLAGAAALLAGPLFIIAAVIALPTLSDEAADQVAALDLHRDAMVAGTALQIAALALIVAGTVWLSVALHRRGSRLAYAGGVLGVAGALVVLFIDSVHAGAVAAAMGVDADQATQTVGHILSSRAVTIFEPLQIIQDLGMVVLAVAVAKAGVARWAATAIAVGAVAEGLGFAAGSRPVVGIAFAVMLAGLMPTVNALVRVRSPRTVAAPQPVAA